MPKILNRKVKKQKCKGTQSSTNQKGAGVTLNLRAEFHWESTNKKGKAWVPIVAQEVKNPTSIHEDASSILGLTQWVKDPASPQAAA